MGGCKCSFRNCTNATKVGKECHFFHFPVKQWDRCVQWIKQSQKPHFLDLHHEQLKNKVICEEHFSDDMFQNSEKRRLLKTAVPIGDPDENDLSFLKSDVKVLPRSSDGTIFTLDEEFLNNSNNCIPTYNIDNGSLVLKNKCKIINFSGKDEFTHFEYVDVNASLKKPKPILNRKRKVKAAVIEPIKLSTPKSNSSVFVQNPANPVFVQNPANRFTIENLTEKSSVQTVEEIKEDPVEILEIEDKPAVGNELEKVSREIKQTKPRKKSLQDILKQHDAAIARLEKQLVKNKTVRTLKRAPPSYLTLLNILTNNKSKYSEKELKVLKVLSSNSEVYNKLKQELGWKLPDIKKINQNT